jgi:hypothetical protein
MTDEKPVPPEVVELYVTLPPTKRKPKPPKEKLA